MNDRQTAPACSCDGRIAIIAVHGVGGPERGHTAESVANMIAAAEQGRVQREDHLLAVTHVPPQLLHKRWRPQGRLARFLKSFVQSWRSDFMESVGSTSTEGAPSQVAQSDGSPDAGAASTLDLGARFTDYLIAKAHTDSDLPKQAEVAVVRIDPASPGALGGVRADVFELYWADLSRLGSGVGQVMSELFTLIFRFSRLSTEALAVGTSLRKARSLRWLAKTQRFADWIFSRVLGPSSLLLLFCLLLLLPADLLSSHALAVERATCLLFYLLGSMALVYRVGMRWLSALLLAALPVGALSYLARSGWTGDAHLVMLGATALFAAIYYAFLSFWEIRFRATLSVNILVGGAALLTILGCVSVAVWRGDCSHLTPEPSAAAIGVCVASVWKSAALTTFETCLIFITLLWCLEGFALAAVSLLYEVAARRCASEDRPRLQLLVTSRLGLFTSIGVAISFFMLVLKLLSDIFASALSTVAYTPFYFVDSCGAVSAVDFLTKRAQASGAGFSVVALLLMGLMGFVVLVFMPSVLREVRVLEPERSALGCWLTAGYHAIERQVRIWGLPVGLASLGISVLLTLSQIERVSLLFSRSSTPWTGLGAQLNWSWLEAPFMAWSRQAVTGATAAITGGTITLLSLAKLLSQARRLSAPLDAVLDVDNHFREFPRDSISRVQIVERYVALLDHIRMLGYAHVMIVAHSQGTVITADLLRYLRQRSRLSKAGPSDIATRVDSHAMAQHRDRVHVLSQWLEERTLVLLTVGSPLRQLYELRFPDMYSWVLSRVKHSFAPEPWNGPPPSELGVAHWSNLWASGDYVGRWLWSERADAGPQALSVDPRRYEEGAVQCGVDAEGSSWRDACIGADAHTHYFDLDQLEVVRELQRLLCTAGPKPLEHVI